jgi:hypothetical protein
MKIEDYHRHPAIGASGLKAFAKSPARYFADYLDPQAPPRVVTPALKFGPAWHCALFEPGEYLARYTAMPEGLDRRTKEGKAAHAALIESGREVLDFDDFSAISEMIDVIRSDREWARLTDGCAWHAEKSFFYGDALSGVDLKIRPDAFCFPCEKYQSSAIIDGKTCLDASQEGFGRDAFRLFYWMQAALYCDVLQATLNTASRPEFFLAAQEKAYPYLVKIYRVTDEQIEFGREQYREMLPGVMECQKSGIWPGYGVIEDLNTPRAAQFLMDQGAGIIEKIEFTGGS